MSWERWSGLRTGKSMAGGGHVCGSVITLVPAAGRAGEAPGDSTPDGAERPGGVSGGTPRVLGRLTLNSRSTFSPLEIPPL